MCLRGLRVCRFLLRTLAEFMFIPWSSIQKASLGLVLVAHLLKCFRVDVCALNLPP